MSTQLSIGQIAEKLNRTLGLSKEVIVRALTDDYPQCFWGVSGLRTRNHQRCLRIQEPGSVFCKTHISSAKQETSCVTFHSSNPETLPHISEINSLNDLSTILRKIGINHWSQTTLKYIPEIGLLALDKSNGQQQILLLEGDVSRFQERLSIN